MRMTVDGSWMEEESEAVDWWCEQCCETIWTERLESHCVRSGQLEKATGGDQY